MRDATPQRKLPIEPPLAEGADDDPFLDTYAAITGAAGIVKVALEALVPELRGYAGHDWLDALETKVVPLRNPDPEHPSPTPDSVTNMTGATYDEWVKAARSWLVGVEARPPDPFEVNLTFPALRRWPHFDARDNAWMKTCQTARELGAQLLGLAEGTTNVPGIGAHIPTVKATGGGEYEGKRYEGLLIWKRMDERGGRVNASEVR